MIGSGKSKIVCAYCRYWVRSPHGSKPTKYGECRYNPPRESFKWPRTEETGWCGKYKTKTVWE